MNTVDDGRTAIDRIDSAILRLLSARTRIAIELGRLKRRHGAPVCSPEREAQVLSRVAALNSGPLAVRSIHQIFRLIIRETRRAELGADLGLDASLPNSQGDHR